MLCDKKGQIQHKESKMKGIKCSYNNGRYNHSSYKREECNWKCANVALAKLFSTFFY